MLNNNLLFEDSIDINKKELCIKEVAPRDRMGQEKNAISYLELPLPPNYKNPISRLKSIRLTALLVVCTNPMIVHDYKDHSVPSGLIFSFESTCGDSYISDISTYDMGNYYSDLQYILSNNYSFKDVIFSEDNITTGFTIDLLKILKPYSIEEIKTILYIYNNPIGFKNNYLKVLWNTNNYNYSVDIGSVRLYFYIGLNYDETKCITQVYWNSNLSDKDFNYIELQAGLNRRIYEYMPWGVSSQFNKGAQSKPTNTGIYTGSELPMSFVYYYRGKYSFLESECDIINNNYIRKYLLALLTHKIVYESQKEMDDFLVCEMMHNMQN